MMTSPQPNLTKLGTMPVGRPTKLTPEVQARIVEAIEAGNYIEVAAAAAGISKFTFYGWIQRGTDEPDSIYSNFANAVEKARATAEARSVARILKAGNDGTWQADAWYLERSAWQRWGRRTQVTGDQGEAIKVQVDHKAELLEVLGIADSDD